MSYHSGFWPQTFFLSCLKVTCIKSMSLYNFYQVCKKNLFLLRKQNVIWQLEIKLKNSVDFFAALDFPPVLSTGGLCDAVKQPKSPKEIWKSADESGHHHYAPVCKKKWKQKKKVRTPQQHIKYFCLFWNLKTTFLKISIIVHNAFFQTLTRMGPRKKLYFTTNFILLKTLLMQSPDSWRQAWWKCNNNTATRRGRARWKQKKICCCWKR